MEVLVQVEELKAFITGLIGRKPRKHSEIIVPARAPDDLAGVLSLTRLQAGMEFCLDDYRAADPAKVLFYLFRERVTGREYPLTERLVAGIKACDMKALKLLDRAMINDEFTDPAYSHWRRHTTIISSDCTSIHPTCHCNLTGGTPYAEEDFDLNLTRIKNEYLITAGSDKGRSLLELIRESINCGDIDPAVLEKAREQRAAMAAGLNGQNGKMQHSDLSEGIRDVAPEIWKAASEGCVGCGGCTNICPTCYCLILNDESSEKEFIKERSYDSCQLAGYATVAGGGTPRPSMTERFRNRYLCKLQLMERNFQVFGCTGCGRCIEVCPAGIDIRKVVETAAGFEDAAAIPGSSKTVYQGREV
ncbi:MAG: 4Fe-4S dicluster domain-containing protein [Acidobacteriota bacterium]